MENWEPNRWELWTFLQREFKDSVSKGLENNPWFTELIEASKEHGISDEDILVFKNDIIETIWNEMSRQQLELANSVLGELWSNPEVRKFVGKNNGDPLLEGESLPPEVEKAVTIAKENMRKWLKDISDNISWLFKNAMDKLQNISNS